LFVVLAFRYAGERLKDGPWTIWLPIIWIAYCASRPFSSWFNSGSTTDIRVEDGNSVDRLMLLLLIGICFAMLQKRRVDWSKVARTNRWLFILCVYMAVSIVWSDSPWISFKRWFRFCGTPMMGLLILTEPNPLEAMETVFRRTAYVLVPFSLLLIKYYPDLGMQYDLWTGERMWVGVTTQKNSLGRLCLISAFFLSWAVLKAWPHRHSVAVRSRMVTDLFVLLLALFILRGPGGTYSATSISALVLGFVAYLYLLWAGIKRRSLAAKVLAGVVAVSIVLGISIPTIGGSGAASFVTLLGRDVTFTGRTEIWRAILPVACESPICGMGYGSFWINPPISYSLSVMVNEAHNGYLDVFAELGLIGVGILVILILVACRNAGRAMANNFEWGGFALCMLLITVVHNITESSFLRPTNHMGAILFFMVMLAAWLVQQGPVAVERHPPAS